MSVSRKKNYPWKVHCVDMTHKINSNKNSEKKLPFFIKPNILTSVCKVPGSDFFPYHSKLSVVCRKLLNLAQDNNIFLHINNFIEETIFMTKYF